jgi:large subunit ribosomal protein L17
MRHVKSFKTLNRTHSHRKALYRNIAEALFKNERIKTTLIKAKEVRRVVEKLITKAKEKNLHNIRIVNKLIKDKLLLFKLFDEIAPRYINKNGGYTRIIKLGKRKGDGAELAYLELIEETIERKKKKKRKKIKPIDKSTDIQKDETKDEIKKEETEKKEDTQSEPKTIIQDKTDQQEENEKPIEKKDKLKKEDQETVNKTKDIEIKKEIIKDKEEDVNKAKEKKIKKDDLIKDKKDDISVKVTKKTETKKEEKTTEEKSIDINDNRIVNF